VVCQGNYETLLTISPRNITENRKKKT
jgi:hypothetical protein